MGISVDQPLVGHSHNLCTILMSVHPIGKTVCWRLCPWVVDTILPLDVLPSLKRWPIQAKYSQLLGVLAGVIWVGCCEFPLYQVSSSPRNAPFQSVHSVLPLPILNPHVFTPPKMWYIYIMVYYSSVKNNDTKKLEEKWMELEKKILSELTQTQKDKRVIYLLVSRY